MQNHGDTSPGLTSIVIVTFNQLAYTKLCLESIARGTDEPHELIVVDNGSTDGTVDYLRGQPGVKLIENATNRGYAAAANRGLAAATGDFILTLNNDVVVPRGWLGRLLRPFADHPDLGLAGPRSNNISGPQKIAVTYTDLSKLDDFAAEHAAAHAGELRDLERLVGFCLLFPRQVMQKIGVLDERFGIGNFEDDDFCRRAKLAGFRAAIVGDAYVHHFGSVSLKAAGVDVNALLRKNQRIYNEKWSAASAPPLLSLCMIVRNSARTLADCLGSIRPWVDEMIVVDTGSADNTMDIARSFGAIVHQFPWCDSFAAARNESLKYATGQWVFWMDSDDTIDAAIGRKLRELVTGAPASATAFILKVRCPAGREDDYGTETVVDHVKIFRNHPAIRFTGRIHEQVLPAIRRIGGEVLWTDLFVSHSGSDSSPEGKKRKLERDLRLLELELADDPDSTFALFNFGMTLLHSGRASEAINALCRSLQLATPVESHVRKIYALLAAAYAQLGRAQTALKTCLQGLAVCPRDPELMFRKATLEQSLGKLAEAEKSLHDLIDLPPGRHFSSIDRGIVGIKAWHNLATVHERQGRPDLAAADWRRVIELDPHSTIGWRGLVSSLWSSKDIGGLENLAGDAAAPADLRTIASARAMALRGDVNQAVKQLESAVASGGSADVLDELCRLTFTSDLLDAAERWLTELTHRCPGDASAHLNLATVQYRLGRTQQAADSARKSLALRPNYSQTLELLAKCEKGNLATDGKSDAHG
jgi:GT2 family glycosyltransferase/tetratricopeptide (TPR) repeat protein